MPDAREDVIFRRLFDADIIGIRFADRQGWITRANDFFLRMLGYERGELPLRWDEMTPPEWEPIDQVKLKELGETGVAQPWEKEYWHRDGHRVPVLVAVALLGDSQSESVGFVLDRTDHVREQRKVQQLAASRAVAEEAERRRIAKGIHDEIGQNLAVAKLKLDAIERHDLSEKASESLADIRQTLDRTIHACRGLTFELASPVLYELGLDAALEDLGERAAKDHGIRCQIDSAGLPAVTDNELDGVLFRVTRELIHNVVKHARAETLNINLEATDHQIRIAVADDGVGFDVGCGFGGLGGFGLLCAQERLSGFGGHLEIDSTPGAGTRVQVVVPIELGRARLETTG